MPLSAPGLPGLPPELAGPVAVQLSKPVATIPPANALPGGCLYEPKWDGYRLVVVRTASSTRLWSKQGRDLTDRFPDIAAAALAQVPAGTVLDGEVVIWHDDRLDFGLLQQRMSTTPGRMAGLAAAHPASYVAFDLLAAGGSDLRGQRLARRRAELERLAARWAPPLQLSPATSDPAEARQWFTDFRPAGVEGLVAKGAGTRYAPGRREWLKVKSWETTEVLAGGVIGPIERPASWWPAATGTGSSSSSGGPARCRPGRPPSWPPSSPRPATTTRGPTASAPAGSAAGSCPCR